MNKSQKDIIVKSLEINLRLYTKFQRYLNKQELDIEFILYEDKPLYFDTLWFEFTRGLK